VRLVSLELLVVGYTPEAHHMRVSWNPHKSTEVGILEDIVSSGARHPFVLKHQNPWQQRIWLFLLSSLDVQRTAYFTKSLIAVFISPAERVRLSHKSVGRRFLRPEEVYGVFLSWPTVKNLLLPLIKINGND